MGNIKREFACSEPKNIVLIPYFGHLSESRMDDFVLITLDFEKGKVQIHDPFELSSEEMVQLESRIVVIIKDLINKNWTIQFFVYVHQENSYDGAIWTLMLIEQMISNIELDLTNESTGAFRTKLMQLLDSSSNCVNW